MICRKNITAPQMVMIPFRGEAKSGLRRKECRVITGIFKCFRNAEVFENTDSATENILPVSAGEGEKAW